MNHFPTVSKQVDHLSKPVDVTPAFLSRFPTIEPTTKWIGHSKLMNVTPAVSNFLATSALLKRDMRFCFYIKSFKVGHVVNRVKPNVKRATCSEVSRAKLWWDIKQYVSSLFSHLYLNQMFLGIATW